MSQDDTGCDTWQQGFFGGSRAFLRAERDAISYPPDEMVVSVLVYLSRGYVLDCASALAAPALIDRVLDETGMTAEGHVLELHAGASAVTKRVQRRLTTGTLKRESLTCGPGTACYPDAMFDLVISRDALHCIASQPRRLRIVRDAARVLKPGGTLAVIDRDSVQHYASLVEAVGLAVVGRRPESVMTLPRLDVLIARRPMEPSVRNGLPIGHSEAERTLDRLTLTLAL
jgi:SAM-dependent methyltransferase